MVEKRRLVVPIEGGLGAQILGIVLFDFLKESSRRSNTVGPGIDFTYFSAPPSASSGLSVHDWQLDYYGISRSEFDNVRIPREPRTRISSLLGRGPKWLHDGSVERQRLLMLALSEFRPQIISRFPVSESHLKQASEFLSSLGSGGCVVHLRRGDYLNVASHVVADQDLLPILKGLIHFGVNSLLFISDSEVNLDFFRSHLPSTIKLTSVVGGEIHLSHALMRQARVLVTSNSQFSLSAAVLNDKGFRLMPKVWFSGRHASLQEQLLSLADWLVVN